MGKIIEMDPREREVLQKAYSWMERERVEKGGEIYKSTYSTIADYYAPFDMHISFFYDTENEKIYVRTYIYASGATIYEELRNPEQIVNESDESRVIIWVLLRNGVFLCKDKV